MRSCARARPRSARGKRFSLALPLNADGPQMGFTPGRENPVHSMTGVNDAWPPDSDMFSASDDKVTTSLQAATHWDALSHVSSGGVHVQRHPRVGGHRGRRGVGSASRRSARSSGGPCCSTSHARAASMPSSTRHAITADDLDAACELGKVRCSRATSCCCAPGKMTQFLERRQARVRGDGARVLRVRRCRACEWFHGHDVAAVATDNYHFEVFPSEREDAVLPCTSSTSSTWG